MVKIVQKLVSSNKYNIKCPYGMTPEYITVHNTANDATAENEISYMNNNNNEVSYHFAVDNIQAVQGLPLDRNGWHCGDGGNGTGNRKSIGIEICYSKSGGDKFTKAENNAVELIVYLLKKYGWGIDRVKKHQDWSNKYCPHRTLDLGWNRFLKMIENKLNASNSKSVTEVANEVIAGKWGNGSTRRTNLTNAGYNYSEVQAEVNRILGAKTISVSYYARYNDSSGSLVDALNSIGVNSSFSNRKAIAIKNGITNYTGTASQNIKLLNLLKQGKLKK